MPIHDWTRVEAGIFHDFHNRWLAHISEALNCGLLPANYYALTDQHAGRTVPDILTLHAEPEEQPASSAQGSVAVVEPPPRVRLTVTFPAPLPAARGTRRTLVIRHVSGHRIVALLELVSPANKDRPGHVDRFARKVAGAVRAGVNVLTVDLFPPGLHDPQGMHGAIASRLDRDATVHPIPPAEPVTLVSYVAARQPVAHLEHRAVGTELPPMPLYLTAERFVNVPLEPTYEAAYRGLPAFWRNVLDGIHPAR